MSCPLLEDAGLRERWSSCHTADKMAPIRNILTTAAVSQWIDVMNSCLYGNGTSFVESLLEDFVDQTGHIRSSLIFQELSGGCCLPEDADTITPRQGLMVLPKPYTTQMLSAVPMSLKEEEDEEGSMDPTSEMDGYESPDDPLGRSRSVPSCCEETVWPGLKQLVGRTDNKLQGGKMLAASVATLKDLIIHFSHYTEEAAGAGQGAAVWNGRASDSHSGQQQTVSPPHTYRTGHH
ncbi:actin filament-associated protein 1-like 1 isoform X1 [Lates japonicus]|uniref:Actin filament-associated protein 1-like 1 isoform X1 n=1 Tax=Lates japonicus TaxID=270547 RepID=A0AAD3RHF4_LATJO|nr:actin filament-associated protein 1-like 1 isoform X1 [Lates japonicus]